MIIANAVVSNATSQLKRCAVKASLLRNEIKVNGMHMCQIQCYPSGLPGSGVGKGGGGGGAVRESGGGLGQFGAAQEEGYFFKKQLEQLKKIKKKLDSGESLKISQKEKDDK